MIRSLAVDAAGALGLASIVYGAREAWSPLGWIVLGAALLALWARSIR